MFTDGRAFDPLTIMPDHSDTLEQARNDNELDLQCEAVLANLAQPIDEASE